jgi:folate-binding protein YgfZ
MQTTCGLVLLDSLGVLRASGPDAVAFLQGQLSNDVARLNREQSLLAGYHNPQGRVIALLRLIEQAPQEVLAVLPRELIGIVSQRLAKFVLRARVKLSDESSKWTISGVIGAAADTDGQTAALPATLHGVGRSDGSMVVRVAQQPLARWLVIAPDGAAGQFAGGAKAAPQVWQQLAIASGEPQVYAATSEEFVAQMLNLDALGAISFEKGCYTGQEVIARAHYRGRVKRRMQRFLSGGPCALKPGDAAAISDGRLLKVVDAASCNDGRCEFLAVTTVGGERAAESSMSPPSGITVVDAQQLALPYPLPL